MLHQKHLLSCKAGAFSFVLPFVRLCTGIEQPVRPRRSRRSRPGGTVLRTVPQGAGDSRTGHQKHLLSCKAGAFSFVLPFVRLCTGIEQPVRPRRSRRSRPGGTVLRTVPQGAGDSRTGHQKHLLSCKAGAFSFVLPFCKSLYGNRTARPAAAKPAVPAGWDSPADCSTGRGRFSVRVKYRSA